MTVFEALAEPISQADFARLVGITAGRVSQLQTAGTLTPGASGATWLLEYCARLREQSAGRASDGPLDLVQERAALARAHRELAELKKSQINGTMAPIELLAEVLATASAGVAEQLDALPVHLRRRFPELSADALAAISEEVGRCRNAWVEQTSELVAAKLDGMADEDDATPEAAS